LWLNLSIGDNNKIGKLGDDVPINLLRAFSCGEYEGNKLPRISITKWKTVYNDLNGYTYLIIRKCSSGVS
jgi:hypothetical protein